jgi:hypothetical protein
MPRSPLTGETASGPQCRRARYCLLGQSETGRVDVIRQMAGSYQPDPPSHGPEDAWLETQASDILGSVRDGSGSNHLVRIRNLKGDDTNPTRQPMASNLNLGLRNPKSCSLSCRCGLGYSWPCWPSRRWPPLWMEGAAFARRSGPAIARATKAVCAL